MTLKKFVFCEAEAGWQTSDVHFPSTGRAHGLRTDARKVLGYRVVRQIARTHTSLNPGTFINNAASFKEMTAKYRNKKIGNVHINVKFKCVRVTTLAVEQSYELHVLCVCVRVCVCVCVCV
jgi:hypothetical protein